MKMVTELMIPRSKGNFFFLRISSRTEDTYPNLYNSGHISPIAMHIPHSNNESESFSLGKVMASVEIDVADVTQLSAQSQDCLDFISTESLVKSRGSFNVFVHESFVSLEFLIFSAPSIIEINSNCFTECTLTKQRNGRVTVED